MSASTWRATSRPGGTTVEPSAPRKPGEHRMIVTISVPVAEDPGALSDGEYERLHSILAERVCAALNRGGMR